MDIRKHTAEVFPDDNIAAGMYFELAKEYLAAGHETVGMAARCSLADVVRIERMKSMLQKDIESRGVGYEKKNGRQTYWQENRSVGQLAKIMEQQRRALERLGLIRREPDRADIDDDDDGFDDL